MKEREFRANFYARTNELMKALEYQVVACAIRKEAHVSRYGMGAVDPYVLSLEFLVERLCFEVGNQLGGGLIIAESRGPILDREFQLAWEGLRNTGTDYVTASAIKRRIGGVLPASKKDNIAGLQLADLVVSPIGRYVLGKAIQEDYKIIESKFRRRGGKHEGAGLVVFPKS